ncbi:MAG: uroporphyrinogen-III C-methyltransferase [Alphaproteobacteria bacterium]
MTGICYFVGAGPGDPDLITVKGVLSLQKAEIVFYDALLSETLLDYVPASATRVFVGKRAGVHSFTQEEISQKICAAVASGQVVVRLKGGDSFVFGRGGEEVIALKEAGLSFEIIPGVTAGIAAPAYAGIPVTHRALSTAVTFVTGHETPEKDGSQTDWKALAQLNHTLCIYMGRRSLADICALLIAGGRSCDTPAAVIQEGTFSSQRTVTGTLSSIAEKADAAEIGTPAMIVVGEVVALRDLCQWYEKKPLFGKNIVVNASPTTSRTVSHLLREEGADVFEFPAIDLEKNTSDEMDDALQNLQNFDAVILTSRNGVAHSFERLHALGLDARAFADTSVAVVGSETAEALFSYGVRADIMPDQFSSAPLSEALLDSFDGDLKGKEILLLRTSAGRPGLPKALKKLKAHITDIAVYKTILNTVPEAEMPDSLLQGEVDTILFTAPSTVQSFYQSTEFFLPKLTQGAQRPSFVSIGPVTSAAMRDLGLPVDQEADPHSVKGLVSLLIQAGS